MQSGQLGFSLVCFGVITRGGREQTGLMLSTTHSIQSLIHHPNWSHGDLFFTLEDSFPKRPQWYNPLPP